MERRFTIVGAGMGAPSGLTGEAREALCAADLAVCLTGAMAELRKIENAKAGDPE